METLYLVDGSGFIFRAFYSMPAMQREDGTPVNAVYGFCKMLNKLLREFEAKNIAVIFDAGRKTFRNDIYPEYKSHRPPLPPEMVPQFALIRAATAAYGVTGVELQGFEADDLIASYAMLAAARGQPVVIVSSDKDLMQLVRHGVEMFDPLKSVKIGPTEVFNKFGVIPEAVIDVQALAGDSVDNIPGVPGIGLKTAAELVNHYGDLEAILAAAGEIKQPKRRQALLDNADKARLSKQLVTLDAFVEVPTAVDQLVYNPDHHAMRAFLTNQGFFSMLEEV